MRIIETIKEDIKLIELKEAQLFIERRRLEEELFNAEYVKVEWADAEEFFKKEFPDGQMWGNGPEVRDDSEYCRETNIGIYKQPDGSLEMWLGGYKHKDCFPRGGAFFVERKYGEKINA